MSTICLAAQRSYVSGEAVWFSYRMPSLRKIVSNALLGIVSLCVMLIAGLYAQVYWQLRHPAPEPVKKCTWRSLKRSFPTCTTCM